MLNILASIGILGIWITVYLNKDKEVIINTGKLDKYVQLYITAQSRKFKRVSLNETLEAPFWGHYICVDFNLRNLQKTKTECKETT